MKKIYSLLLLTAALICLPWSVKADVLTVNDGEDTNIYVPVYGFWADTNNGSTSQFVVPAASLNTATYGTITGISFYASSDFAFTGTFTVKLMQTEETTLSSKLDVTDATLVYSGTISIVSGVASITFSTPFSYEGSNLLVEVKLTVTGNCSSSTAPAWYGVASGTSIGGSSGGTSRTFLPKATFTYTPGAAPTCPKPTALDTTALSAASASFDWTKGKDETSWLYICAKKGATIDWSSASTVNTEAATVNGLEAATDYTFYLRALCGEGDTSRVVSMDFKTECEAISTLPWNSDATFAAVSNSMPTCWEEIHTTGYNAPYVLSTTSGIRFYGNNNKSYSSYRSIIILPLFTTDIKNLKVKITYATSSNAAAYPGFQIGYIKADEIDDASKFHSLTSTSEPYRTTSTSSFSTSDFVALADAAEGARIAICFTNSTTTSTSSMTDRYGYIKQIVVESAIDCSKPATPVASNLTGTTAHLAWTANEGVTAYKYICQASGSAVPDETAWASATEVNTNSVDLTELTDGQAYDFYVMCACGTVASDPCTFTPLSCPAVTGVTLSNKLYNSVTVNWTTGGTTNCDVRYSIDGGENWESAGTDLESPKAVDVIVGNTYKFAVKPHCNDAENAWVACAETYAPQFPVPAPSVTAKIDATATIGWAAVTDATGYKCLHVAAGADAPNATAWAAAETLTGLSATLSGLTGKTEYDAYVLAVFASGESNPVKVTFTTSTVDPIISDEFTATKTSIEFSWTNEGAATQYQWKSSKEGSDWSAATANTSATETGLTAGTDYTFYVRSYYGENKVSDGVSKTFQTECDTYGLEFIQNFGTTEGVKPTCWTFDNWADAANAWYTASDFSKTGQALRYNAKTSTSNSSTAVMPAITLAEKAVLKFYVRNYYYYYNSYYISGKVVITDGETSKELEYGNNSSITLKEVDLSEFVGKTVTITFHADGAGTSPSSAYLWIDDVTITYAPIATPTELAAVPTADGANLTWSHAENGPFNVQYRAYKAEEPFNEWINVEGAINTKAHTLTGLTEGTKYEVRVRANASEHRVSDWTEPVDFTPISCATPKNITLSGATCNGITVTWEAGASETAWNIQIKQGEGDWSASTTVSTTPTYSFTGLTPEVVSIVRVQAACEGDWAESESFTLVYTKPSNVAVASITDVAATASWNAVADASGYKVAVALRGEDPVFGAKVTTKTDTTLIGLDAATEYDFYVAAVYGEHLEASAKVEFATITIAPKNLTLSAVTATTATLTWANDGAATTYEWAEGNDAAALVWDEVATATKELTGLTANTSYTFYVRSKYANDATSDSIKLTFTTECEAIATASLPWINGFEDYAIGTTTSKAPACWAFLGVNEGSYPYAYVNNNSTWKKSGSKSLYIVSSGSKDGYVIFPEFEAKLNTLQVTFSHKEESASKSAILTLGYMTNIADAETFVAIGEAFSRSTSWQEEKEISLASIPEEVAASARLAFKLGKATDYYFSGIDDISIEELPSCIKPALSETTILPDGATFTWTSGNGETNFQYAIDTTETLVWTATDATTATVHGLTPGNNYKFYVRAFCDPEVSDSVFAAFTPICPAPTELATADVAVTTATLSWTAAAGISKYQYVVMAKGVAADWSAAKEATTNSASVDGLTANTAYTFYVRSVFNETIQSAIASLDFRTECAAISALPWSEDFENADFNVAPACWALLNAQDASISTYPYIAVKNESGYYKGSKALFFRSVSTTGYAILPEFGVNLSTAQINFSHKEESGYGTLVLGYLTDVENAETFTTIYACTSSSSWKSETAIALGTIPSGARLAFQYSINKTVYYDAAVDDIRIEEIPACAVPTGLAASEITASSAEISWTSDASAWKLQYKKGASDWTDVAGPITNPYLFEGLTENTKYAVRVAAVCGENNESEYCLAVNFTTECRSKAVSKETPWSESFDAETPNSVPSCWDEITANNEYAYIRVSAGSGIEETPALRLACQKTSNNSYDVIALLPEFEEEISLLQIDFQYKNSNTNTNYGQLQVGYYSTGTFTAVQALERVDAFTAASVDFGYVAIPEGARMAIKLAAGSQQTGSTATIDNIVVGFHPTCYTPKNLKATATAGGASLTWSAGKAEEKWNVRYKATADDNWKTVENITTASYTLTGLTKDVEYEAQVRAYCSALNQSEWSASVTFTPLGETTGIGNAEAEKKAIKLIENNQLVIIRDGAKYNALGEKIQ